MCTWSLCVFVRVQCLRKDAESRRRELHIRTYAVIPLNEECGIIEWVNNTTGLRHILTKLYKERGTFIYICKAYKQQNKCDEMILLYRILCVFQVSTYLVKS